MEITTALLCDSAALRDGLLLNIRGGGIRSIKRPSYPAGLGVTLALVVELEEREPQPLDILLVNEAGDIVNKATTTFGFDPDAPAGLAAVPLVFRLADMAVPTPGRYGVMVESRGEVLATIVLTASVG